MPKFVTQWGKVGSDAGASRWNYIQSFTSGDHLTLGTDATGHNWGRLYTEGSIANLGSTWEKINQTKFRYRNWCCGINCH